jgi:predicted ATPase
MLTQLHLTNFKSFAADADPIPFSEGVTILVGANASGKSNVLDALRFLQRIGMHLSIAETFAGQWAGGKEVVPALRGGAREACWSGSAEFAIRAISRRAVAHDVSRDSAVDGEFDHQVACRVDGEPRISNESFHAKAAWQDVSLNAADLAIPFDGRQSLLLADFCDRANPFTREDAPPEFEEKSDRNKVAWLGYLVSNLLQEYRRYRFLHPLPSAMQRYVARDATELGENAENLCAVLHTICMNPARKQEYLGWLAALCAPEVRDIDFDVTKANDVMVSLIESNGTEKPISVRSVSDGTLRFMGILAALFSAEPETVFLLEEIENGLHPTRIHLLVEVLEQFAESRKLQIIATTHSSQVLLGLSEKALRNAVLFARTRETPGTITRRLGDLPHFDEVTEKMHIDRLFTTGWLEMTL